MTPARGADLPVLAEQLREMVRLHNDMLASAKAPALMGHRQPPSEFDDIDKLEKTAEKKRK